MTDEYAIETDDLSKTYVSRWRGRELRAVDSLSLKVPTGSKFGLLGANGAGKTTFVKMLLAAVKPTGGSARLFGRDAWNAEARRPVGYLPENHRFPTYLTGEGMLDFYAGLSGVPVIERKKRVPELLELVGLAEKGPIRIKKYSKGMLQRLGLAQALIHKPELLVLDEPTDGVDPVGRRHVRDILDRLTGQGVTVFINSHLLSEVETFCDSVAILQKGRLVLEGKMAHLLKGKGYRLTSQALPERAIGVLRQAGYAVSVQGDEMVVQVVTRDEANAVVDQIRRAGLMIDSVTPTTSSLEELFIKTTQAPVQPPRLPVDQPLAVPLGRGL